MSRRRSAHLTPSRTITVQIPTDPTQLIMLRSIAETVCLTADFDIGTVTDIRIALDEAATILMRHHTVGSIITCQFVFDEQNMRIRLSSISESATPFDIADLGWHVLRAMTDDLATSAKPFDPRASGYPVEVRFARSRGRVSTAPLPPDSPL
ncbi:anti-sigma factor [Nocardia sp. NPDC052001]|uniref:ATP-binding protein n=1 Tax=Nocardia sp. NPDC052001 TaxID=3154853 RepID=UPI0034219E27